MMNSCLKFSNKTNVLHEPFKCVFNFQTPVFGDSLQSTYLLLIQQIKTSIFYRIQQNTKMEKLSWKQVRQSNINSRFPNARWGHSSCVIEDEVIFFGGYAGTSLNDTDSTYMNDVWAFNTITMEWREVETTGEIPSHRSNCSINYDKENKRIIVFGGGGPNKVRFNTINILDWKTKEWMEITPKINEPAPWERTYHTAELFLHYLIIFGGEGLGDLEDLWIFDFETLRWTEVPIPKTSPRPCARRFHSSALVNNQFFVIAGCYAKYRCLSDIYSIDLTPFLQTGKLESICWRQRKMKDYTFLTRWGHTSAVYQNKICVFGGRFCNDLNDILTIDPNKDVITMLKVSGESPKPRRRHSACFVGNSMLIFGGFNGEYYNDLHYISIKFPKRRISIDQNISNQSLQSLKAVKSLEWEWVETNSGEKRQLCIGLLIQRFNSIYNFDNFIKQIDGKFSTSQLDELLLSIYRGYGEIDKTFVDQYGINMFQSKEELEKSIKKSITSSEEEIFSVVKRSKQIEPIILLDEQNYAVYLEQKRMEECYFDITLNINDEAYFRANKALLAVNSQYFSNLFSHHYQEEEVVIRIPVDGIVLFQTLLNYLSFNFVVASSNSSHTFWIGMLELAEYFCLQKLIKICENELLSYVSEYSCEQLLLFALTMNLKQLGQACSSQIIKRIVNSNREGDIELLLEKQNENLYIRRQAILKKVYYNHRFDLLQKRIDTQDKEEKNSLKKKEHKSNEKYQEQKENNQIKN